MNLHYFIGLKIEEIGRNMKNTIVVSFVLILSICACFYGTQDTASAAEEGNYTYTVYNGEATITDYTCAEQIVTIPSTLGGYPTVAIGANAFYSCTLTSVIIPNSVTMIGDKAFKSCTFLTHVTMGSGVTSIGDSAFYYCTSLPSMTISDSVTTIGDNAFAFCSSLSSVVIGKSVTTIGNNAFSPCSSLNPVIIPDNVISIGDYALSSDTSLASLTIGAHVKTIGKYAFASCSSLPSVTIPNNVTSLGDNVFSSCSSLTSVTIGTHVKTIGRNAFASCSSLSSISFLGLSEPTSVGVDWIKEAPVDIRGHAYSTSNFPAPGGMLDFHGLTMGSFLVVEDLPPVADFTWSPTNNLTVNQTITFDASASYDPDGSLSLYEWDWNNDSIYDESYPNPTATHSWTQAGDHLVTLRVTDNRNATNTKTLTLVLQSTTHGAPGNKGTPGFELIYLAGAIVVSVLLWTMKKNET